MHVHVTRSCDSSRDDILLLEISPKIRVSDFQSSTFWQHRDLFPESHHVAVACAPCTCANHIGRVICRYHSSQAVLKSGPIGGTLARRASFWTLAPPVDF